MKVLSDFFEMLIGLVLLVLGSVVGMVAMLFTVIMQFFVLILGFLFGGLNKEK